MGSFYQQPPMRRGAQVSTSAIGLGGVLSAVTGSGGKGRGSSSSSSFFGGGSGSGKTSPMPSREDLDRIAAHKGGVAAAV